MTRLRFNGVGTTLSGPLASTDTTIALAAPLVHSGGTPLPALAGGDYVALTVLDAAGALSEIMFLTAYQPGASTGTVQRAQEGTTAQAHPAGSRVIHAPTVRDIARRTDRKARTAGSVTINSGTWMDVDNALDLIVTAAAGDTLLLGLSVKATSDAGTYCVLDMHTRLGDPSGTTVVTGGPPGSGPATSSPGWATNNVHSNASGGTVLGGTLPYVVRPEDVEGDVVRLRLRAVSGGPVSLIAADPATLVSVVNFGQ